MTSQSPHLTAFDLDALALGALQPGEGEPRQAHLSECAACRLRLERLQADHRHFSSIVAPRAGAAIERRVGSGGAPWARRLRWLVPSLSAVAAVLVVLAVRPRRVELGVKGGGGFQVYARHAGSVFPLVSGSRLAAGDQLRMVVESGGLSYVLVVSADGSGGTSVYYPFGGTQSAELGKADRVELDGSLTLDASAGPERLFALFSRQPLQAAEVLPVLHALAAAGPDQIRTQSTLDVPAAVQASLFFEKGPP